MKKIASKFVEVMKECSHIAKNGTNTFHSYKYATSADVLEKVNAALVKHGIASVAVPELISMIDVKTAKGNIEHLATVKIVITLMDQESDETMTISGIGGGQDSGDKAVMKAQTAAIKYAYLLSLAVSTGDDPEADSKVDEHTSLEPQMPPQQRPSTPAELRCEHCGDHISPKVAQYSQRHFGKSLCMNCQAQNQSFKTA